MLSLILTTALAADGPDVLSKMDTATTNYEDQVISWKVVNQEPGKKEPGTMRFTVHLKGDKSITAFSEPADLKGTRILVLSRTNMSIWLPQFSKVRRIASHVTQQGFMGTTYAHADMSARQFGDVYNATLLSENDESWTLSLLPKEDAKAVPYAKAEIDVSKEHNYPLALRYYNDKGDHIKTETRSDYKCEKGFCLAGKMRMEDHTREGAWTELQREEWTMNSGLADSLFTMRSLQMGY